MPEPRRYSRFESEQLLRTAMRRVDELGGPERQASAKEALVKVLAAAGLDLNPNAITREVHPKGLQIAAGHAQVYERRGLPPRQQLALTFAVGVVEGVAVGLYLAEALTEQAGHRSTSGEHR